MVPESLEGRVWSIGWFHLGLNILQSIILSWAFCLIVGLCTDHYLPKCRSSDEEWDTLIYKYNDRSLGVDLMLWPFSSIIVVGFLLESITV